MKVLVIFGLCLMCGLVKSEELTKENLLVVANHCQEETGATDDDVTALLKHEPAASTESKCMRACVMKKFGVLNDEGKLVESVAVELGQALTEDEEKNTLIAEVVDECDDITVSDDHCEAAAEYGTCLDEHAREKGLSPPEV